MPYTAEHKEKTRRQIVRSARRLFNRHGFNGVSIDEIMADAGLTRGGFYNHFGTKEELYAEVVQQVLACREGEDATPADGTRPRASGGEFISAYLSPAHFEDRDNGCPLMALPSDVARGGEPVRRAYRQVLEYMVEHLQADVPGARTRERALAVAALCIGGMAVARAIDDVKLAHEVREAARNMALTLGGWNKLPAAAE
ncbi:MAG TPA: TetR/AcrR family transcriptional regulator [Methyloceanibacter sp.]|nr:TetR/AcrR family transcriptional regulator [Methyloceanibacter sp.]